MRITESNGSEARAKGDFEYCVQVNNVHMPNTSKSHRVTRVGFAMKVHNATSPIFGACTKHHSQHTKYSTACNGQNPIQLTGLDDAQDDARAHYHYAVLGLSISASRGEIYEAYRHCLGKSHENVTPPSAESEGVVGAEVEMHPRMAANEALKSALVAKRKPPGSRLGEGGGGEGGGEGGDAIEETNPKATPLLPFLKALKSMFSTIIAAGLLNLNITSPRPPPNNQPPPTLLDSNDDEDIYWHGYTPQSIIANNKLTDAVTILTHPVKKKVFDRTFINSPQQYEGRRIVDENGASGDAKQQQQRKQIALTKASEWRASLLHGHERDSGFDEEEFGRVRSLKGTSVGERFMVWVASGMCGEVVAGWVEGMEV